MLCIEICFLEIEILVFWPGYYILQVLTPFPSLIILLKNDNFLSHVSKYDMIKDCTLYRTWSIQQ